MGTYEEEREYLKLMEPDLRKLYGQFKWDDSQRDRPDAALILTPDITPANSGVSRIGIEITQVDPQSDQQYKRDDKKADAIRSQQFDDLMKSGAHTSTPIKRWNTPIGPGYIYDGVIAKADLYESYKSEMFQELILLAVSNMIDVSEADIQEYLKPWTHTMLSAVDFPFDRVIFFSSLSGRSVVVYDRATRDPTAPPIGDDRDLVAQNAISSVLPMGQAVSIAGLLTDKPLISRKKVSRTSKKRKK